MCHGKFIVFSGFEYTSLHSSLLGKLSPSRPIRWCVVARAHAHALNDLENGLRRAIFWYHLLSFFEQFVRSGPVTLDIARVGLSPIDIELLVILLAQVCEVRILPNVTDRRHRSSLQTLPEYELLTVKHSLLFFIDKFLEAIRDLGDLIDLDINSMQFHRFVRALDLDRVDLSHKLPHVFRQDGHQLTRDEDRNAILLRGHLDTGGHVDIG